MKLLIMSDSHGWDEEIVQIMERHRDEVDAMIHCGDSELRVDATELKGIKTVKGNCDFGEDFPEDVVETFDSFVVYATHGHLYNVKMTHVPLSYRAVEVGAHLVCFGHSHVASSFKEEGMVFVNPGSIRLPRSPKEQTYVICEVTESAIHVHFYERESGEELHALSENYPR